MGAVFALFGGFYYWFGKITGYQYSETLGRIHFWIMFIGVKTLAPLNLAWCWNIYQKGLPYIKSNHVLNKKVDDGKKGFIIKNGNQEEAEKPSDRQSAGVWKLDDNLTAPQRINAKELWYIMGLIEGDGSYSCYVERNKDKLYVRAEMAIGLKNTDADAKLLYWVKTVLGNGIVSVRYIAINNLKEGQEWPTVARYILRSKSKLYKELLNWYKIYPALTIKKITYIEWVRLSIEQNKVIPKKEIKISRDLKKLLESEHIKDWLIGFIEAEGSFNFCERERGLIAEFNIAQTNEKDLLTGIGEVMGITKKNKISKKEKNHYVLTAVSLADIQAVIYFMTAPERVRLKGMKKVKFILWLTELRKMPRYKNLKIPDRY